MYISGRVIANREEGAAVPNQRQGKNNLISRMQMGQRHIHLNWSNF